MKNLGFTLAEVLVSLAIVGVISALTLPALMNNTTSAQIGPKLNKAVAMFEQANEGLLNTNSVDTLSDGQFTSDIISYLEDLSNHLKGRNGGASDACGSIGNGFLFTTKDNMSYCLAITTEKPTNTSEPGYKQRIGNLMIDINAGQPPNNDATDRFYFSLWNDGTLKAKGSTGWGGEGDWTVQCAIGQIPEDPTFCAGHIFENNYKVLYR